MVNLKKYVLCSLLAGTLSVSFTGNAYMAEAVPGTAVSTSSESQAFYSLDFDASKNYTEESKNINGQAVKYRAYRNVVYAAHPKNAAAESMNIFIPSAYFENGQINGYTKNTAPIFMPNGVGGYMPGEAGEPQEKDRESDGANAILTALSKGYVVAAPAIRGRTTMGADGTYVGKAPAFIVDYKAAVRYLRHNKKQLPAGDTEKIISNGTSAGGALSALLGATGNAKEYEPYLKEIGAADERDDIFASSDYCPITNLEHADMAYEWMFNGVNSLNLKDEEGHPLTLNQDGTGSFRDYIKGKYMQSAQDALNRGLDVSSASWVKVQNGKVVDVDLEAYPAAATRMKAAPAFDKLDLSSAENDEFGSENNTPKHFSAISKQYESKSGEMADSQIINLMNPLYFIGNGKSTPAKHYRIRHGAIDRDTSLAIPAILALKLQNNGVDVNFYSPWNRGHSGDYDLPELFNWMDSICK